MTFSRTLLPALLAAALSSSAVAQDTGEPFNPVRLNQLGFQPDAAKRAVVPDPSTEPLRWRLVDQAGQSVAEGTTRVAGDDRASGQHVHVVDFSAFGTPGTGYRLVVNGAESRPFPIADDIYRGLPKDALAYFYHNRAGTPIEARHVGERWARPAGHLPEVVECFAGTGTQGNVWRGCDYEVDVTGGWYDAGDHGKYVVNGGITVWTLLNLHERQAQRPGGSHFPDGAAAIPEAGNGIDDLLDEVRWEMEFLLRMQVPEGKSAFVPVGVKRPGPDMAFTEIDASGMAHHKIADVNWTEIPTAPHEDQEKRVLYPPTTGATLNLAANAGQCARVWRSIDPAFSARCLAAAERAWAAALRNPDVYAAGDFTGSGGYGDSGFSDEFYWAAAELFISTGKPEYREALTRSPHFRETPAADFSWPRTATLGTISLATVPNGLGAQEIAAFRASIVDAADSYLGKAAGEGYVIPYSPDAYPWGSNSSVLNRAITLALAHDFTGERRYRDGVVDAMDYLLGRNPLDQSYVSGYGARPMRYPHHRHWANQVDPNYPPAPAGALSGGPNSMFGDDETALALRKAGCAPQTCWADKTESFSMNEVAINWNAPLVWVAAFLDEK